MFSNLYRVLAVGTAGRSLERYIFTSSVQNAKANLYSVLGLTPKATQSDIKKAYYKLSMQYHPDKNQGSDLAATKFREITEAYEILGSYKTRRRYDQGMMHKSYSNDYEESPSTDSAEDDPQTRFYKQHMRNNRPPPPTGATPKYNFEEWTRAHYGANFNRRQTAKRRYEHIQSTQGSTHVRNIELSVLLICFFVCSMVIFAKFDHDSYDNVESATAPAADPSTKK